jgi:hypothetical protein
MRAEIYTNKKHSQDKYLFIGLARQHYTNEEVIVYVPLRVEKEWAGTARTSYRTVEDFNENFEWADDRLPEL